MCLLAQEQGVEPEVDHDDVVLEAEEDSSAGVFSIFGLVRKKANTDVIQVRECSWRRDASLRTSPVGGRGRRAGHSPC